MNKDTRRIEICEILITMCDVYKNVSQLELD